MTDDNVLEHLLSIANDYDIRVSIDRQVPVKWGLANITYTGLLRPDIQMIEIYAPEIWQQCIVLAHELGHAQDKTLNPKDYQEYPPTFELTASKWAVTTLNCFKFEHLKIAILKYTKSLQGYRKKYSRCLVSA